MPPLRALLQRQPHRGRAQITKRQRPCEGLPELDAEEEIEGPRLRVQAPRAARRAPRAGLAASPPPRAPAARADTRVRRRAATARAHACGGPGCSA